MSALENLIGQMTLAELARLANTSVEQVVAIVLAGAASGKSRGGSGDAARVPPSAWRARRGTVPRGGLRLDHIVAALASVEGPAKLEQVREQTGGSVPQVRAALQKLSEAGRVRITGERRGTRYSVR